MSRHKMQYECLDEHCKTITVDLKDRDGMKCPRCDGPTVNRPFKRHNPISEDALYVRSVIVEQDYKHCYDLTPHQVETVLNIYKGRVKSGV